MIDLKDARPCRGGVHSSRHRWLQVLPMEPLTTHHYKRGVDSMKKNHNDNVRKKNKIAKRCREEGSQAKDNDEQGCHESGAKVPGVDQPTVSEDIADNAM